MNSLAVGESVATSDLNSVQIYQYPEPSRQLLLLVGVLAIAITFWRFWVNLKSRTR